MGSSPAGFHFHFALPFLVFTVFAPDFGVHRVRAHRVCDPDFGVHIARVHLWLPPAGAGGGIARKLDVSSDPVSTTSVLQTLVFTFSLADVAVTLGYKSSTRQRPVKARRLGLAVLPRETASPYEPTTIGRR